MDENQSYDRPERETESGKIEAFKNQVLAFLTRLSQVAGATIDKLRILMGICLACAVWLTFFTVKTFNLSLFGVLPAVMGFAVPVLLIWTLYRRLKDVAGLPEHLPVLVEGITEVYADLKGEGAQRISDLKEAGQEKNRIAALFGMGNKLLGLRSLLTGLQSKLGEAGQTQVIESVILVAGPGFVFLMTLATIGTVLLAMLTVISFFFM